MTENRFEFQVSVGTLAISWTDDGLIRRLDWTMKLIPAEPSTEIPGHVLAVVERVVEFFRAGAPIGKIFWEWFDSSEWTDFQKKVYDAICEIPFGETRTYGWVARRVGKLAATRAVGQALKNNPLPILIPCHRVVSVNSLGGFMGSDDPQCAEMDLKRKLQTLETEYLNPPFSFLFNRANSPLELIT